MEKLRSLILGCLLAGKNPEARAETVWLNRQYRMFMEQNGYRKKSDADQELYRRIFGAGDCSIADTQKLRYWRSGKHMPNDRHVVERFGIALELDSKAQMYLMKNWFDRCDRCFSEKQVQDPVYVSRQALMQELVDEYLLKCRYWREAFVTKEQAVRHFRHYYYTDSLMCVSGVRLDIENISHYRSVYYQSELERNIRLLGEIPRKTMIRHLFLLLNPFISRQILNEKLETLGYLPLREEHSMVTGERLDLLLICLLACYETACYGREPGECRLWLESALAETDRILAENGQERMRFMKYKGLHCEETDKKSENS